MLQILNKNIFIQWILFLSLFSLSIFIIINHSQMGNGEGVSFLFTAFSNFFSHHQYFGKGIIIFVLFIQIVLLQYYFSKNEFSGKFSLLPSCFYITILLLAKSLHNIQPFFFTSLFLLSILAIRYDISAIKLKNNAFWVGTLIAFATCFDQSAIILFIIAIFILFINQFSRLKEIGILLMGFLLIYFYFFSYYFLINQHCEWFVSFQQLKFFGFLNNENPVGLVFQIKLGCLFIVYLYFLIRTRLISESKVVMLRKRVITLNFFSILLLGCLILSNSTFPQLFGYLFLPITIYLGYLSQEKNPLYINEIVSILTLVVLCL